jgi:hypothetical protein
LSQDIEASRRILRRGLRPAQRLAAIAQGLGDMDAGDACFAVEIGERAGDTQGAVIAPRA